MKSTLATTALVLSMATLTTVAQAAQIGSGPVYAAGAYYIECYWNNEGTNSITPTKQEILDRSGTVVAGPINCANNTAVTSETTCTVGGQQLGGTMPYSCQVNFSSSPTLVRGTMNLLDSSGNALVSTPLR
jgi:hypothetical protein